jgi:hypothetical protein
VIFDDKNNQLCLKGPLKPEEVVLIEHHTIFKTARRIMVLILWFIFFRSKYVFFVLLFILFTIFFFNGINDNYDLIAEQNNQYNWFSFDFLKKNNKSASIWKAFLMTLTDVPRAVVKLLGYAVGDFTSAVFSDCGNLEKFIGTLALMICLIRITARRFL